MAFLASQRRSYREMLWVLHEYEGWRCLWRPVVGALLSFGLVVLPIAGGVASVYIGADRAEPVRVVLGVVVATALDRLAVKLGRRRLWRGLVAKRLWTYEKPAPESELPIQIRDADVAPALRALRRARLNPASMITHGSVPPDAPWLDVGIRVQRPPAWHPANGTPLTDQIKTALAGAGIPARIADEDVHP